MGSAAGSEREHVLCSLSAASAAVGKQALSVVVVAVIPGAGAAPAGAAQVLVTWPLYRWHVIC